ATPRPNTHTVPTKLPLPNPIRSASLAAPALGKSLKRKAVDKVLGNFGFQETKHAQHRPCPADNHAFQVLSQPHRSAGRHGIRCSNRAVSHQPVRRGWLPGSSPHPLPEARGPEV